MPPEPARVAALGDELVRVHDRLRADPRLLRRGSIQAGRPLAVHCLAFCDALTRHHSGEEAGAFPALAARFPEPAPVPQKMSEDHELIAGIAARVEELGQQPADDDLPAVVAELDGLAAIMDSHFAFEERRIRAALDRPEGTATDLLGP